MTFASLLANAMGDDGGATSRPLPTDAELALVAALRGEDDTGARRAFEDLFHKTIASLTRFAARVGALDNADDVVIDVFATLWERRQSLEPTFRPEPYLYRAVRNRTLQYLRGDVRALRRANIAAQHARIERDADSIDTDALSSPPEIASVIWRVVDRLPESQRSALTLRLTHGFPLAAVAETMQLSVPAVKMLLQRAFKTLRVQLAPLLDTLEP